MTLPKTSRKKSNSPPAGKNARAGRLGSGLRGLRDDARKVRETAAARGTLAARGSGRDDNQRLGIRNYRQLAPNDSDCLAKRNFDRKLTVTGANNSEQRETRDSGIWLKKAVF
jgi:hypothetical protein